MSDTHAETALWTWDDERLFCKGEYVAVLESVNDDAVQPDIIVHLLNDHAVLCDDLVASSALLENAISEREKFREALTYIARDLNQSEPQVYFAAKHAAQALGGWPE